MRTTKTLLTIAVITTLPFGAMAENISGAMYTAPIAANNDHPAPTTNATAPYGRIDIDTADQDHIASTAYVKGAYNSAIAAVNKTKNYLYNQIQYSQPMLQNSHRDYIDQDVIDNEALDNMQYFNDFMNEILNNGIADEQWALILDDIFRQNINGSSGEDNRLLTLGAALRLVGKTGDAIQGKQIKLETSINGQNQDISSTVSQTIGQTPSATSLVSEAGVANYVNNKRVEIYTTWDDDTAKTEVAFVTAQ